MSITKIWKAGLVAAAMISLGCGSAPSAVSLSVRVGTRPTATGTGALQQGLAVNDGIEIDRIRLVVRELELYTGTTEAPAEIEKGPFLVDLSGPALDGSVIQVLAAEVPAGTYREVEFKIEPLLAGEGASPTFDDVRSQGASLIVDGAIDGQRFVFVSAVREHQEYEGNIVVGEGQDNVTLNIDPSSWFAGATGRLDPRDDAARLQIEGNIQRSLDLFEDDDHDGTHDLNDDHGGVDPDDSADDNTGSSGSDDVNDDH